MSEPQGPYGSDDGVDPLMAAFTALRVAQTILDVVRERLDEAQRAETGRRRAAACSLRTGRTGRRAGGDRRRT
ncbi:hypothetical protein [Streptomyces sp. NPDC088789]|uniref:hypothetical protein n=1 Tax=Streptomyces sp. NPDC088789 TaxID=3365899 RepID=UPI00382F28E1